MSEGGITQLLREWRDGGEAALEKLIPIVYPELHRIARIHMRRERPGRTLQTSALVNEAYLRLAGSSGGFHDREHFFAVSAQVMRRILVDSARERRAAKRGGAPQKVTMDKVALAAPERDAELIHLDEALGRLERIDPRKARMVELRFFGGFDVEETAKLLGISAQSVHRDWKLTRAWLTRELNEAHLPG
jgi:RNA polymerase sigma-70 factor (ECF subfamily)